ncbi:MAG: hypothetical protein WBB69_12380 [Anaerolineales bacterium]
MDTVPVNTGTQQITETLSLYPSETETSTPATDNSSEPFLCQEGFEDRELREPYQRYDGKPRYTLSEEELIVYLDLMGIESICFPVQFGAPFVNVDWNSIEDPPATGRMVSIGFEELYSGGGWSRGYLVYATYDFSIGTEYDVFATRADLEQITAQANPNLINIGGVEGFIRYFPSFPMGMQVISQTYIIPFEDYYIAAVLTLGAYDPAVINEVLREMEEGKHPDLIDENIKLMEILVSSIRFK